MNNNTVRSSPQVLILGTLGLAAITALGWACDQQAGPAPRAHPRRLLAWLVTQGVTVMGWTVDRIAILGSRQRAGTRDVLAAPTHERT